MNQDNPPADHVTVDGNDSASAIEENLKSRSTWIRLVFMIAFIVIANVAVMVATVVVLLGFLWVLFTGDTNEQLRQAGRALATYFAEIVRFLTYNSETKPFPFGADWPSADD
jgi:hypothetical protein